MMVEGVGLGAAPSFLVRADIDAGRIEPVLLDWKVLPDVSNTSWSLRALYQMDINHGHFIDAQHPIVVEI